MEHADTSEYEGLRKQIRQQIQERRKSLEQVTKQFNSASSGNVKKRNDINALRKERTLYDHIYKTLEYQILGQEKRLYSLIEENQKQEAVISGSEENLANIVELVSKNKYEDFYKIIEQEKRKYMDDLKMIKTDVRDDDQEYMPEKPPVKFNLMKKNTNVNGINFELLMNKTKEELEAFEDGNVIKFYDELFAEFRIHTTDEDLDLIEHYITNGDELNEQLYQDFVDLENEAEILKQQYDSLTKLEEKHEVRTVTTAITKNDIVTERDSDPLDEVNEPVEMLNHLVVSLPGNVQYNSKADKVQGHYLSR